MTIPEGCHPKILEALSQYNLDQQNGYGLDIYSENAANIIRENQNPLSLKFIW